MLGTWANAAAILAGTLLGVTILRELSEEARTRAIQGLALGVLLIGISMALSDHGKHTLAVLAGLAIGGLCGQLLRLEARVNALGHWVERRLNLTGSGVARAFITASLVYVVGPMTILGALEDGLRGRHDILFAKAMLDGVVSVMFAGTLGPGVALAALPVVLFQGAITLFASNLAVLATPAVLSTVASAGGLLIVAIGLNLLKVTNLAVADLLPAVVFAPLFVVLANLFA